MSDATGAPIAAFFQSLEALIPDERACHIDRMVLYATVAQHSFTLRDARTRIEAAGASVPIAELRQSLSRLTLAYAIQKRAGAYIVPVPLIRDYVHHQSEGDPAEMLALEAREWQEEWG